MIYKLPKELPPTGDYLRDSITQVPKLIAGRFTSSAWLRHIFHAASCGGRNLTPGAWVAALRSAVACSVPASFRPVDAWLPAELKDAVTVAECVRAAFHPDSPLLKLAAVLSKPAFGNTGAHVRSYWHYGAECVEITGTNPATDAVQRV